MGGKWLELLKEIAPRVTRAAVLRDPTLPAGVGLLGAIQSTAPDEVIEWRNVRLWHKADIQLSPDLLFRLGALRKAITNDHRCVTEVHARSAA
jgi:hypothetical protein